MRKQKEYRATVTFDDDGRVESVSWCELGGVVGPMLNPKTCPMDPKNPGICPPKEGIFRMKFDNAPDSLDLIGVSPDPIE